MNRSPGRRRRDLSRKARSSLSYFSAGPDKKLILRSNPELNNADGPDGKRGDDATSTLSPQSCTLFGQSNVCSPSNSTHSLPSRISRLLLELKIYRVLANLASPIFDIYLTRRAEIVSPVLF
jgi:hypothetical protein